MCASTERPPRHVCHVRMPWCAHSGTDSRCSSFPKRRFQTSRAFCPFASEHSRRRRPPDCPWYRLRFEAQGRCCPACEAASARPSFGDDSSAAVPGSWRLGGRAAASEHREECNRGQHRSGRMLRAPACRSGSWTAVGVVTSTGGQMLDSGSPGGTVGIDYSPPEMRFKVATEDWEFREIHRLNHLTFAEEIPQHRPQPSGLLVDRFHGANTYLVALRGTRIVGMLALRAKRPFSLDQKLNDLDSYLPPGRSVCEVRLLAISKPDRAGRILQHLFAFLW